MVDTHLYLPHGRYPPLPASWKIPTSTCNVNTTLLSLMVDTRLYRPHGRYPSYCPWKIPTYLPHGRSHSNLPHGKPTSTCPMVDTHLYLASCRYQHLPALRRYPTSNMPHGRYPPYLPSWRYTHHLPLVEPTSTCLMG